MITFSKNNMVTDIGGDGIHVRAVRYGYKKPNGFTYKEIQKWYKKRTEEWPVVDKFLNDAFNNYIVNTNRETPYILLEQLGNGNVDEAKYTLSYQAYIQYFQYEQLQQAKIDTRIAIFIAIFALVVTVIFSCCSIYFSIRQTNTPIRVNVEQIK